MGAVAGPDPGIAGGGVEIAVELSPRSRGELVVVERDPDVGAATRRRRSQFADEAPDAASVTERLGARLPALLERPYLEP